MKPNSVCSPELESCFDDVDNSLHVFVQFVVDDAKVMSPLKFVKNFPSSWRDKDGRDKNYLYKVFYSPDPDDTPAKALKRLPEIPLFEANTAEVTASGYYRAAVLAVAETRKELESLIDSKRLSVGLLKYKRTSFDLKSKASKGESKAAPEKDNVKQVKAKVPKGKKKSVGVNKDAQKKNTAELKVALAKRFLFLRSDEEAKEVPAKEMKAEKVKVEKESAGVPAKKMKIEEETLKVPAKRMEVHTSTHDLLPDKIKQVVEHSVFHTTVCFLFYVCHSSVLHKYTIGQILFCFTCGLFVGFGVHTIGCPVFYVCLYSVLYT